MTRRTELLVLGGVALAGTALVAYALTRRAGPDIKCYGTAKPVYVAQGASVGWTCVSPAGPGGCPTGYLLYNGKCLPAPGGTVATSGGGDTPPPPYVCPTCGPVPF